jgi:hypothetical protein
VVKANKTSRSQSQIGQDRNPRRQGTAQAEADLALSVLVRSGPIGTGVNGTLVARPARTTPSTPWRRWLQPSL